MYVIDYEVAQGAAMSSEVRISPRSALGTLPIVAIGAHVQAAHVVLRKGLASEDKLGALRKGDASHNWQSLDDRRCCILCEKTFSGRMIEISIGTTGRVRLRCPSDGCTGTPREWLHPGNPLVSAKAWRSWVRVLDRGKRSRAKQTATTTAATGI